VSVHASTIDCKDVDHDGAHAEGRHSNASRLERNTVALLPYGRVAKEVFDRYGSSHRVRPRADARNHDGHRMIMSSLCSTWRIWGGRNAPVREGGA
jgi:hypothetical protein